MILRLLDVPVVSKKNKLKFGRGRTYKTEDVVQFEERLREEALKVHSSPLSGPVSMTVSVHVPDRRRRDLQNFSDTICDALNGVWYNDDSQIVKLSMRKVQSTRWCLIVTVQETEPCEDELTTAT